MAIIVSRIVEVCVFRFVENRSRYLMLKRSPGERIYPNLWQFVTGSIMEGEKAHAAAFRELQEETNLVPERFWVVPSTSVFYDPEYDAINICPQFAAQVGKDREPALSAEHCAWEWLSFEDARNRLVWPGQKSGLETTEKYILGGEEAGTLTRIQV